MYIKGLLLLWQIVLIPLKLLDTWILGPIAPHVERAMHRPIQFVIRPFFALLIGTGVVSASVDGAKNAELKQRHADFVRTYERDAAAATFTIFHEARGIRVGKNTAWRCVMETLRVRAIDERWKVSSMAEAAFQLRGGGRYMYSWLDDREKLRGIIDAAELPVYNEIKAEVLTYLREMDAGVWKSPCGKVHSFHDLTVKPNPYFKQLCHTVTVVGRTSKSEPTGLKFYGDCPKSQFANR